MMDLKFVLTSAYDNANALSNLSYSKMESMEKGVKEKFNPDNDEILQVAKEVICDSHPEIVPDKIARQLLLDCQTSLKVAFVIYMIKQFLMTINLKFKWAFSTNPFNLIYLLLVDMVINPYLYGAFKMVIKFDINGISFMRLQELHISHPICELNDDIYMGGLLLCHSVFLTIDLLIKIMEVL